MERYSSTVAARTCATYAHTRMQMMRAGTKKPKHAENNIIIVNRVKLGGWDLACRNGNWLRSLIRAYANWFGEHGGRFFLLLGWHHDVLGHLQEARARESQLIVHETRVRMNDNISGKIFVFDPATMLRSASLGRVEWPTMSLWFGLFGGNVVLARQHNNVSIRGKSGEGDGGGALGRDEICCMGTDYRFCMLAESERINNCKINR